MSDRLNRRRFVGGAAAALAAAGLGGGCVKSPWSFTSVVEPLRFEGNVPQFVGVTEWLNSPPLTPAELSGKVVLVQFWTYTCINWLRTLPYIRAWSERYTDHGLVVIGVHTPEFSFEHNVDNVRTAAADMRVTYPIAVDNEYAVWNAFSNNYWPAQYFVDANGRIRHHHFGEGAYDESERLIQQLLIEAGAAGVPSDPATIDARGAEVAADWDDLGSPESYLGLARTENFAPSGRAVRGGPRQYAAPMQMRLNQWALDGSWTFENEFVVSNDQDARIIFQFHARDLHLVMGPATPGVSIPFRVRIEGVPPGTGYGTDVDEQGNGTVSNQRLYQLIRQPLPIADRRFEIQFLGSGAAAYAFTFG